jgi:hypothetical protein
MQAQTEFFFFTTAYLTSRDAFATQRKACAFFFSNLLCHPLGPSIIWVPAIYPSGPLFKLILQASRHGFRKVSTYIASGDIFVETKTITTL